MATGEVQRKRSARPLPRGQAYNRDVANATNKWRVPAAQRVSDPQYAAYRADVASDYAEIAFPDVKGSVDL